MPIYEYSCESCGHELEALQGLQDDLLTDCPECGASALRKRISRVAFRLKGSGWYETDFKDKDKRNVAGDGSSESSGNGGSESSGGTEGSGDKAAASSSSSNTESGSTSQSSSDNKGGSGAGKSGASTGSGGSSGGGSSSGGGDD
jgi:putative FmdB family regulatory protein